MNYECPVCHKYYGTLISLQNCITSHVQEEAMASQKAREAQKKQRLEAIKDAITELEAEMQSYANDYHERIYLDSYYTPAFLKYSEQ